MKRRTGATIYFKSAANEEGKMQTCVYAECHLSVKKVGPIWGHGERSIKRALVHLTLACDCPGKYHYTKYREGFQVPVKRKTKKH